MEKLKQGYKQTDIGVIPEAWEVKKLGQLCFPSKSRINPITSTINYKCIELEHLSQNSGVILGYANSKDLLSQKSVFEKGDVLFGKLRPYLKKYWFAEFNGVCTSEIWVLKATNFISNMFLFHLVQSERVIESANLSTGTKMPRAEWKTVAETEIPFPPTQSEQTAIATALSDVDALIAALDKKITKKQQIKQGAMLQLLTGRKRLLGFSGEWLVKSFKDVCWFQEGPGLRNWQFTNSGIKVINVTNLENGFLNLNRTDRYISLDEFHKMYEHFEIDENDIVVASSGNSYGKTAKVRKQDLPLLMNTSVIRLKPFRDLDYNFLWIFLNSIDFKSQIDLLITGGAQPNFGPAHLNKLNIFLPLDKSEQTAIAQILTDMDDEISRLVADRNKYKQLKVGMMQQLLTGKIRLKEN